VKVWADEVGSRVGAFTGFLVTGHTVLTEIGFRFAYIICSQGTVVLQGTYLTG
jgi:hypothetical protein